MESSPLPVYLLQKRARLVRRGDGGDWHGRGGLEVGKNVVDGFEGEFGAVPGWIAEEEGAVVLGVSESFVEGWGIATPGVDGVAMDAGLFSGGDGRCAARQGADDVGLLVRKSEVHKNQYPVPA